MNDLNNKKFQEFYSSIFNNINLIKFKIAGNIDKNLVQNIHNHLKEKLVINANNNLYKKNLLKDSEEYYYVLNYYQKTTLNEPPNGIQVSYYIPDDYEEYMELFLECF